MSLWVVIGVFAIAAVLTCLYSALIIASQADDLMEEEYIRKHKNELRKTKEENLV